MSETVQSSTACGNGCCWHTPSVNYTLACYPPQHQEVCCHCGAHRWVQQTPPPIPEGHGPHYPRQYGMTITTFNS